VRAVPNEGRSQYLARLTARSVGTLGCGFCTADARRSLAAGDVRRAERVGRRRARHHAVIPIPTRVSGDAKDVSCAAVTQQLLSLPRVNDSIRERAYDPPKESGRLDPLAWHGGKTCEPGSHFIALFDLHPFDDLNLFRAVVAQSDQALFVSVKPYRISQRRYAN
jgi:hypothetical protein